MIKISEGDKEFVWVILVLENWSLFGDCDLVIGI